MARTLASRLKEELKPGLEASKQVKAALLPPQALSKPTLVLDLDNTLVHNLRNFFDDKTACARFKDQWEVNLRPGVLPFLKVMSQLYEVVLFTAANQEYADQVVDTYLDPERAIFTHRLYKNHCSHTRKGRKFKDVSKLGRDMRRVIILDDLSSNFRGNRDNGIEVFKFEKYGAYRDKELAFLTPLLRELASLEDVRPAIRGKYGKNSSLERDPFKGTQPVGRKLTLKRRPAAAEGAGAQNKGLATEALGASPFKGIGKLTLKRPAATAEGAGAQNKRLATEALVGRLTLKRPAATAEGAGAQNKRLATEALVGKANG